MRSLELVPGFVLRFAVCIIYSEVESPSSSLVERECVREPMRTGRSVIKQLGIQRFGAGFGPKSTGLEAAGFKLPGFKTLTQAAGLAALLGTLPGCQSITGNPSLSQVRIIDASPDAPGVDVYQGSAVLAYNLGLGTVTSYVPIAPGTYSVIVDTAGTKQQLVSAAGTFLNNSQYTVLVGNYAATLQELILKDQSQPAPSGDISVRIIDQSVKTGAVDVYMVPSGSTLAAALPILTDISFNTNSGYLNIPSATYTLVVVPTGTKVSTATATLYTGAAVTYPGGSARTLVLIDTVTTSIPGIQVVTANDYDTADEGS